MTWREKKERKERKGKQHLSLLANDLALTVISSTFFTVSFRFCTFLWIFWLSHSICYKMKTRVTILTQPYWSFLNLSAPKWGKLHSPGINVLSKFAHNDLDFTSGLDFLSSWISLDTKVQSFLLHGTSLHFWETLLRLKFVERVEWFMQILSRIKP